jgi:hypothetical protein
MAIYAKNLSNFGNYWQKLSNLEETVLKSEILSPGITTSNPGI